MRTHQIDDPAEFLERGAAVLANEAINSVIIATARRLVNEPHAFQIDHHVAGDPVSGAMAVFDGRSALLSDLMDDETGEVLARELATYPDLEFIEANRPHVGGVVRTYCELTGTSTRLAMGLGAFSLTAVTNPTRPPGSMRAARTGDRERLIDWAMAFSDEAIPEESGDRAATGKLVDGRLNDDPRSGISVWEVDEELVAMSGHSGDTGTGIRVNLVYTPPTHRGHGYATALCADQATMLLGRGYRSVYLFTDLANPTSNAIYERIGYRRVGESERHEIVRD